jgi:carbon monoxide dehydrogenase subunit G
MNSLTKNITINASVEKIWAILADVTRTPEWIMGVQESERTGEIREGKMLRWRERSLLENQNIEMDHEMIEWEPCRKLKVHSALPMNGWMDRTLEIQDSCAGARIQIFVEWDLGIAGMLLGEKKVTALMNSLFEVTLANLKDLAEK